MLNIFQAVKSSLRFFLKDERGVAAALGAVLLPTIIGSAGLAVDGTRYMRAKQIIVSAADAAALSAAAVDVTPGQSRSTIASNFFVANIPSEYKNIIDLKSFNFTDAGPQGGAVVVNYTVNATVKPLVASAVGIGDFNVLHQGTATREISRVEVVLGLPMNGTMCSKKFRTPSPNKPDELVKGDTLVKLEPDPTCAHFNAMKAGVQSFADMMFANQTVSKLKMGIVPYNYKIKMPDVNNIHPHLLANEAAEPDFFKTFDSTGELSTVLPLTTDKNRINTAINELKQTPAGVAWSRTNLPTLTSALMLDPDQSRYFGGNIITPAPFTDKSVEKVMILLTDGSNIGCCFTNWQPGNFNKQYVYFHKPDNEQQLEYCTAMKEAGIKIITIIFDVLEDDTGGKEINNLFARCASGAYAEPRVSEGDAGADLKCRHKQYCYNISNKEQLVKVYKDIAQNYLVARTSR